MQLSFKADGQSLTMTKNSAIVAGSINYITADATFISEDWDGLEKWVHFVQKEKHYVINLIGNEIKSDIGLNLCEGMWYAYIHGNQNMNGRVLCRITTNRVYFSVDKTGEMDDGPFPYIPPSSGEQIIAQAIAARDAAVESARAAKGSEDHAAIYEHGASERAQSADAAADRARNSAADAADSADEASGHADRAKRFADLAMQDIEDKGWMYLEGRADGHLYMVTSDAQTDIAIKDNGEGRLIVVYA